MDKPSPCFDWGTHRHRGKLAVAAAHTTRRGIHTPGVVDGASERASDPDRDTLPGLPYQAPCLTLPHLLSPFLTLPCRHLAHLVLPGCADSYFGPNGGAGCFPFSLGPEG